MRKRILQVNLFNQGGAFSLVYQIQKEIEDEFVFDYYSQNRFINNSIYHDIIQNGGLIYDDIDETNKIQKQISTILNFYKFLTEHKYSIIHIHADTSWKAFLYLIAAKKAKVNNIIVHSHSSGINGSYKFLNLLLHNLLRRYVTKKSTLRLACSQKSGKWMFDETDSLIVINNGINTDAYFYNVEKRELIRNRLNISQKTKVVGTVGDYSVAKNPRFICDLYKNTIDDDVFFLLVGDGPGKKKLENELAHYSEKKRVKKRFFFTGHIENANDYLNAMDYFILPSKFEGVPMSALEAQVNGLNVFVSDNVDAITNCSVLFKSLELDVNIWHKMIKITAMNDERDSINKFLKENKVSIKASAKKIKSVYRTLSD